MNNVDDRIEGQQLDPFSFHIGVASCIPGLGGNEPGYDPNYAFHTPYVEAEPGFCNFIVHFHRLSAKLGTLQLGVYMLPLEPGAQARVANRDRIQLNRLINQGGVAKIRFEAFVGVSFALHGQIAGETDIAAEGLSIFLDRPLDLANRKAAPEARSSLYGRDQVKPVMHLLSSASADFQAPVSQIATQSQLTDEHFSNWRSTLPMDDMPPINQWSTAFVMQALDRYGLLQEGAKGIFLNAGGATAILQNALERRGLSVVAPRLMQSPTKDLELTDYFEPLALPGEFINFDFLWSEGVAESLESFGAAQRFLEEAMYCLRPGGLAIHILCFDFAGDLPVIGIPGKLLFQRRHVERAALVMISRNLEVAMIKIDARHPIVDGSEEGRPISRFGLIARRPPSAY